MKIAALVLFVLMYILMIALPKYRPFSALSVAVIFVIAGIVPVDSLPGAINWNVLMMISGTMIIVHYFIDSRMPNLLADIMLGKAGTVRGATILMSVFTGVISAFIDNVATVLIVAPVGLAICKKMKINPVGMILSIAVSSNLQGAATLVGDTTSIMLGDFADMDFMDFFWMNGRPGIFFAVELGAAATIPVMLFLFRKDKMQISSTERTVITDYVPTVMLILMVAALITASFIPGTPAVLNGIICCSLAVITILIDSISEHQTDDAVAAFRNLDYQTLGLLAGLFVVISGLTNVGVIDDFADLVVKYGGDNIFILYTIIVWGSVLISAFVDNIPYVATMLPVLATVTASLGIEPHLLYFGLLSGATLGGSLTPIGASANITAVGLLRKEGYPASIGQFMKIGIPYTLAAVMTGYLYFWFIWR
ncbi:MAG: TRAP transporter large permease subunit [Mogibacterium sp.]|nr:TRAP transporter large permease subunit [Mogibacterium sp.]